MRILLIGLLLSGGMVGVVAGDAAQHWSNPLEIDENTSATLEDSSGDTDILLVSNSNDNTTSFDITIDGTDRIEPVPSQFELEPSEIQWVSLEANATNLTAPETMEGEITVRESSGGNVETGATYQVRVDVVLPPAGGLSGDVPTALVGVVSLVGLGLGVYVLKRRDRDKEYV